MTRILICFAILAAVAAAEETLTLHFADGKKKTVPVLACDEDGVTVRQAGKEEHVAWKELAPDSAYEARRAFTTYDDGASRLALAEFARSLRLFPEALEELEVALALGGVDEGAFETKAKAVQGEEILYLRGHIDTLVAAKAEPEYVLAAIKRLKERYPDHEANARYEPLIADLVAKVAENAAAKQGASTKQAEDKALERLRDEIERIQERKERALEKAAELRTDAESAIALSQISRIRKLLVLPSGAEKYYKEAHAQMRRLVKTDKECLLVSKEELQKEWDAIDKELVECYLAVARSLIGQRNYKGAVKYVRQVLMYDPINEEALDMAKTIQENRINFKASDITNARPRVNGG
jgi:hypothetical protein